MRAICRVALFALFPLLSLPWMAREALALTEGKTAQGGPYVSGGIALGERAALERVREEHNLWIATAAKKTGAYLADVRVTITDEAGNTVLGTRLDGPWLLVKLKLGSYKVDARFGNQAQQKTTTIHPGDRHEMIFYFDHEVETLPKGARD